MIAGTREETTAGGNVEAKRAQGRLATTERSGSDARGVQLPIRVSGSEIDETRRNVCVRQNERLALGRCLTPVTRLKEHIRVWISDIGDSAGSRYQFALSFLSRLFGICTIGQAPKKKRENNKGGISSWWPQHQRQRMGRGFAVRGGRVVGSPKLRKTRKEGIYLIPTTPTSVASCLRKYKENVTLTSSPRARFKNRKT